MAVLYKHYKGGIYKIVTVNAVHTETGEHMVVYTDEAYEVWVRPAEIFFGEVEIDGRKVKRFKMIS